MPKYAIPTTLLLLTVSTAPAQIVTNGSFEDTAPGTAPEGGFSRLTDPHGLALGPADLQFFQVRDHVLIEQIPGHGGERGVLGSVDGLDLLLHLAGEEVVSVMARTAVRAHIDIEVEDTCAAVLVFESGALGVIQATTLSIQIRSNV